MTLNTFTPTENITSAHSDHSDAVTFAFGTSTLGQVLVAATGKGICAVLLGSDHDRLIGDLRQHFPQAEPSENNEGLGKEVARIVAMIETPAQTVVDLPLDLHGSDFEIEVWQALRAIPAGRTLSYSQFAEIIGMKGGARDVAEACAANKIAVAVPCHRILRKDGTISGYRWGVRRKRALLKREGAL